MTTTRSRPSPSGARCGRPEIHLLKLSPFLDAARIKAPLLLVHGAEDQNPGTLPLQSERLFQALKGTGGRVRYVTLPHEGHAYRARESVLHVVWEMLNWFDTHVKGEGRAGIARAE